VERTLEDAAKDGQRVCTNASTSEVQALARLASEETAQAK